MIHLRSVLLTIAVALAPFVARGDIFADARALGRGVNLGNALDAPTEGAWGIVLEDWYFREISAAGFQSVRVPIRFSAHASASAPYTIDPEFFARVDWVLQQAAANNLVAIVDLHHYEEIHQNPAAHRERFVALWRQIAERYKDQPGTVYFELLNEPSDNLDPATWNAIIAETLPVVRQTNPTRPVIVGGTHWNNWRNIDELDLPADDQNLIGTIHYYEPFEFTHQGAPWAEGSEAWVGTAWEGTGEQQAVAREALDHAAAWQAAHNRPVYLGEFGAYTAVDSASRAGWTEFVRREAELRNMTWAVWDFNAAFKTYDTDQRQWIEPMLRALIPSVDANADGQVDAADYTVLRDGQGTTYTWLDLLQYRRRFGTAVPARP